MLTTLGSTGRRDPSLDDQSEVPCADLVSTWGRSWLDIPQDLVSVLSGELLSIFWTDEHDNGDLTVGTTLDMLLISLLVTTEEGQDI